MARECDTPNEATNEYRVLLEGAKGRAFFQARRCEKEGIKDIFTGQIYNFA